MLRGCTRPVTTTSIQHQGVSLHTLTSYPLTSQSHNRGVCSIAVSPLHAHHVTVSFFLAWGVNRIELPHIQIHVMTIHASALPRLSFSSHLRSFVKLFRMVVIVAHPRCTDKPPPPSPCNPLDGWSIPPIVTQCFTLHCNLSQPTDVFDLVMFSHFPSLNTTLSCRSHSSPTATLSSHAYGLHEYSLEGIVPFAGLLSKLRRVIRYLSTLDRGALYSTSLSPRDRARCSSD